MKALSLLVISILFFLAAYGQDTTKLGIPANSRKRFHPHFKDMLLTPPLPMHKKLNYTDSVWQVQRPPEKKHPVLYVDGGAGISFGLLGDWSVNYQQGKSLFTFRGLGVGDYQSKPSTSGHLNLFEYRNTRSLGQYALLYGWRLGNNRSHAYSFSLGVSDDSWNKYSYTTDDRQTRTNMQSSYAGLPFEANYQWFGRRFGAGFGLKLVGDISKHSFIGFGIDMSLGFHTSSAGK